jgi:hypothetical protein
MTGIPFFLRSRPFFLGFSRIILFGDRPVRRAYFRIGIVTAEVLNPKRTFVSSLFS